MDIEQIKALAEIVKNYGITSLTITENDITISMQREHPDAGYEHDGYRNSPDSAPVENIYNFSDVNEIKAPLVGVFYMAAAPDAEPYVEIGKKIKKGDVLCIIEAMKLMNEINAEQDCEIVDICVKNGDIVEYGQTLFKVI
ncbi:MAG: acetyl-CoA carboxylase biotin carboxyl carrier protein [Eubacteriales bacterium]|jgi:acetyl-CoA carboxylase biotin carboxyl carrier protein|nr:acetyl-CoA carboxylase biotin carboxyl carrier protein [Eubacteriales bacterium]